MFRFKKHIALLSIFMLLLPTIVLTAHLFENHEHTVCSSVNDHHFHEKELDCSLDHYQFSTSTYKATESYTVIPKHFYKTDYEVKPQLISFIYVDKKSSRGPPIVTI